MDASLSPPTPADSPEVWCQWAWLVGRRGSSPDAHRHLLSKAVQDPTCKQEVRQEALCVYWMVSTVDDAVKLQEQLLDEGEMALVQCGLEHPLWWKDEKWNSAMERWFGYDPQVDDIITRLWSWQERPMKVARIPSEVLERAEIVDTPPIDWQQALMTGIREARREPSSAFESFCQRRGNLAVSWPIRAPPMLSCPAHALS